MASEPVVISRQIGTNNYFASQKDQVAAAAKDPQLEQLLSSMKAARERLTSGVETVQSLSFYGKEALDTQIRSSWAVFKWQAPTRFARTLRMPWE